MIPENVNRIFHNAVWRTAKSWVYTGGYWRTMNQPPTSDEQPRRQWVYTQRWPMASKAWVPLHFETNSTTSHFRGYYRVSSGSPSGFQNYTYWESVASLSSDEERVQNAAMLRLGGLEERASSRLTSQLRFPFYRYGDTQQYTRNSPVRHIKLDQDSSGLPWIDDDSFGFTVSPGDTAHPRFNNFLPSGWTPQLNDTWWILSPGTFTPISFKSEPMAKADKVHPWDNNGFVQYGYAFFSPVGKGAPPPPGTIQIATVDFPYPQGVDRAGYRILCWVVWDERDESKKIDVWPIGGYPGNLFSSEANEYGTDSTSLPRSWLGGMEAISNPEDGFDHISAVVNTVSGSNIGPRLSRVWIRHSDLQQRLGEASDNTDPINVVDRDSTEAHGSIPDGIQQGWLNGVFYVPKNGTDRWGNNLRPIMAIWTIAVSNQGTLPPNATSTTYHMCFSYTNDPNDNGTRGGTGMVVPIGSSLDPDPMDTIRNQAFSIMAKSLMKQTGTYGRVAILSRHGAIGTHWEKPHPNTREAYTPGEMRWRWTSNPDEDEASFISAGSQSLVCKFIWARQGNRDLPVYTPNWPPAPMAGNRQLILPRRVMQPWADAPELNNQFTLQAWNNFAWVKTCYPGELNNVFLFEDERSDTPIRSWTFACVGFRRIHDEQPNFHYREHDDAATETDSVVYFNVEIAPDGADGVDLNSQENAW